MTEKTTANNKVLIAKTSDGETFSVDKFRLNEEISANTQFFIPIRIKKGSN